MPAAARFSLPLHNPSCIIKFIGQRVFIVGLSDWSGYVDTDLYNNRAGIRQGRGLAGGDPARDEGDASGDFSGGASSGRKLLSSGRSVGGRVLFFRPARRPEAFRRRRPSSLGTWSVVQSSRRNERDDGGHGGTLQPCHTESPPGQDQPFVEKGREHHFHAYPPFRQQDCRSYADRPCSGHHSGGRHESGA